MQKLLTTIFVMTILVCPVRALAQEKATNTTKLLIDNDKYPVNETRAKPGERNNMQKRSDRIIVHLTAGKQRFTCADGKTEETDFKAGSVEFRPADSCQALNIGTTETHNLVITAK
jgi:hypothetical protein